jgi:large subunit ribosomal protein L29
MKQQEILDLSIAELKERLTEETQQLSKLVFNHTVSAVENPMRIRAQRRGIARMKTEIRKREMEKTTATNTPA